MADLAVNLRTRAEDCFSGALTDVARAFGKFANRLEAARRPVANLNRRDRAAPKFWEQRGKLR